MGQQLFVIAGFGAGSYDALCVGLSEKTTPSAGSWVWLIGMAMTLLTALLYQRRPDFSVLITAFLFGVFFDLWGYLFQLFLGDEVWFLRICLYLLGLIAAPLGTAVYFRSGFPKSAFDGFIVAVKETVNINIGKAKTFVEIGLCMLALAVGGPIGVTTFVTALLFGLILQGMMKKMDTFYIKLDNQKILPNSSNSPGIDRN